VVQFQEVWVQNCLVTSCHFQASSHFCNQNTFNLQDWLSLILHVGVWSKYFVKIPFERNISLFHNNKETKKDMFRWRMRCDPETKYRMTKIHNKMIDNSTPFLDQLLWPYLCFAERFRSLVILRVFHDNMTNDNLLHRFNSSFDHQLPDLILAIVQLNSLKSPPMIFKSPVWIISPRKIVIAWDFMKSGH